MLLYYIEYLFVDAKLLFFAIRVWKYNIINMRIWAPTRDDIPDMLEGIYITNRLQRNAKMQIFYQLLFFYLSNY